MPGLFFLECLSQKKYSKRTPGKGEATTKEWPGWCLGHLAGAGPKALNRTKARTSTRGDPWPSSFFARPAATSCVRPKP